MFNENNINKYSKDDEIATSFLTDIIEEAMMNMDITYDEVVEALKKARYWELFNKSDIVVAGAHEGTDEILNIIRRNLK